jgi:predicted lipoprotein with Yx(FWY)xxD motif
MKTTRRERARRVPIAAVASAAAAVGALAVVPATAAGAASPQVKVSAQTVGNMGKVLVSGGKALYVLTPSGTGCDSACLAIWPALTVHSGSKATAGSGVTKSKLGVTTDAKGAHQVTYGGKPVYFFVEDSKGTVKGDISDEWGKWTAVVVAKPAGSSGSGSTPTTSNSGGSSAGGGGVSF